MLRRKRTTSSEHKAKAIFVGKDSILLFFLLKTI
jgi:hypothetical protein